MVEQPALDSMLSKTTLKRKVRTRRWEWKKATTRCMKRSSESERFEGVRGLTTSTGTSSLLDRFAARKREKAKKQATTYRF